MFKPYEFYGLPSKHLDMPSGMIDWPDGVRMYYSTSVLHTLPTSLRQLQELKVEQAGLSHLQVVPASFQLPGEGGGRSAGVARFDQA